MARRAYARRYAQAIFEIALAKEELDRWQLDLRKIVSVASDSALMASLGHPKFHFDDKAKILSELLKDINPLALNLVLLLVTRGRLDIIGDIADAYQRLLDSYRGVEQAELVTAIPLDEDAKVKLAEYLGAVKGKKVVLKSEVDSAIMGGFIARIEGKLLDGSTRSKLAALGRELVGRKR